ETIGPLYESATYVLQCEGAGGTAMEEIAVEVLPPVEPDVPDAEVPSHAEPEPEPVPAPTIPDGMTPIALYDFSAGSGSTITDRSGLTAAGNLTIQDSSAVTWLAGGGLRVNEPTRITSAGAATGLMDNLRQSQALTVELLVKSNDLTQSGPARIVALSQDGSPNGGNFVIGQGPYRGDPTALEARFRTTATNKYGIPAVVSDGGRVSGALQLITYTRSADGQSRLYVDGQLAGSRSVSGDMSNWSSLAQLSLANEPDGQRPFLGEFYHLAIYDRSLPAEEVRARSDALLPESSGATPTADEEPPADAPDLSGPGTSSPTNPITEAPADLPVEEAPVAAPPPSVSFGASAQMVSAGSTTTLTWSSNGADGCVAGGGWSGTLPNAGTREVGPLDRATTFSLSCPGAGGTTMEMLSVTVLGTVALRWQAPTENVDGSPLTDLAGYRIYYGTDSRSYGNTVEVSDPGSTEASFTAPSGDYYVTMTALDAEGNESAYSNEIVKAVP
ncbi:MAG: LamG-like jellyroll fold domain-containing protein, partial [Pseudomonadota bacterium]